MKRFLRLALPLCLLPGAALSATPGARPGQMAPSAAPPPRVLVYAVVRNGTRIGEHDLTITTTPHGTTVDAATDIAVKILFVDAYSFHTTSHEVWNSDHFVSFKSRTNDNGKRHSVAATADAKGVTVVADGRRQTMPPGTIPGSFWNAQLFDHTSLFDTETGAPLEVKVADLGPEPIDVSGRQMTATHYKITGSLDRDIWVYQGTPVRFQLKGSDNSIVASVLLPEGTQPSPRPPGSGEAR